MDDTLASLVDGPRAQGAFLLKSELSTPWGLRLNDDAALTVAAMVRGGAWLSRNGQMLELVQGDVVLVAGPGPYTLADSPDTPPHLEILPGQECRVLRPEGDSYVMSEDSRVWRNADGGARAVMLSGTYQTRSEVGQRLSRALPSVYVHHSEDEDLTLTQLLTAEMVTGQPGQELVLDRLLDLLLLRIIRAWLSSDAGGAPEWVRAQSDPVVGLSLQLLHRNPEQPWTVESLARRAGVSRATFARKFAALVGEAPMNYLTRQRLEQAATLLLDPGMTLTSVARRVGYGSPFALSAAFKRERGITPAEHRALALSTG